MQIPHFQATIWSFCNYQRRIPNAPCFHAISDLGELNSFSDLTTIPITKRLPSASRVMARLFILAWPRTLLSNNTGVDLPTLMAVPHSRGQVRMNDNRCCECPCECPWVTNRNRYAGTPPHCTLWELQSTRGSTWHGAPKKLSERVALWRSLAVDSEGMFCGREKHDTRPWMTAEGWGTVKWVLLIFPAGKKRLRGLEKWLRG